MMQTNILKYTKYVITSDISMSERRAPLTERLGKPLELGTREGTLRKLNGREILDTREGPLCSALPTDAGGRGKTNHRGAMKETGGRRGWDIMQVAVQDGVDLGRGCAGSMRAGRVGRRGSRERWLRQCAVQTQEGAWALWCKQPVLEVLQRTRAGTQWLLPPSLGKALSSNFTT